MSHYEMTEGQKRFLQRKFAREHEMRRGCDCAGGVNCPQREDPCKGHVTGCECDISSVMKETRERIRAKKELDDKGPRF